MTKHCYLFLALSMVAGCGGDASDAPVLVPVKGKLLINGKPAENVTIHFVPTAGTKGPMSIGAPEADGSFEMLCSSGGTGAVAGTHKVLVKCPWRLDGGRGAVTGDGFGSSEDGKAPSKSETAPCLVPQKYEDANLTPFEETVPAEGKTDFVFDITVSN